MNASLNDHRPLAGFARAFTEIALFSVATNFLLFVPPLYLLQIYDRVLPASSLDTLIYLSILGAAAMAVLGLLEIVRAIYANRVAARLDVQLGNEAFLASAMGSREGLGDVQPLRDLGTIRAFMTSRSVFFLFDLPFAPVFVFALYFMHPLLCGVTLVGLVFMFFLAWLNQFATARAGRQASETMAGSMNLAQTFARNFETVRALGMISNVLETWGDRYARALALFDRVSTTNAVFGGVSRLVRMMLQSAILGIAAYLVLTGSMTAGMIFASSLISGRALQPFDQIIGGWRQIVEAAYAWRRLKAMSDMGMGRMAESISLPDLKGTVAIENLVYTPPRRDPTMPVIKRISCRIEAGETVAIIGPSRAGKSTLARLVVGAVAPTAGVVRMDGADIRDWNPQQLGRRIGYLAQDVELFPGTIADNISRFDPEATDERIVEAAKQANVHELVLSQANGYLAQVGPDGVRLSGGERQRIGLARAFYGEPKLLVLDEPNAHLDSEGEQALQDAIANAKRRGTTVLIITHRPSIANRSDRVIFLRDGQIELFGPTADVMQRLEAVNRPVPAPPAAAGPANSDRPADGATRPLTVVSKATAGMGMNQ